MINICRLILALTTHTHTHTHFDNMSVFLEIRQYIITQDLPNEHIIGACISYLSLHPILEKYNILGADFSLSPN